MDADTKELFQEMIIALDGCTVALEAEAKREKRRNATEGGLREITAQKRLEAVENLIRRAHDHYESEPFRRTPGTSRD